ncbi:MAG: hypothetical protein CML05_03035 [Pseudozobellia sp.]|nr:hypothetical protein [Pseudozobellia sp.]|tara:strand:- start:501 stop:1073 length:573 start_codon:yes stop_codon:yes gene_type:complete
MNNSKLRLAMGVKGSTNSHAGELNLLSKWTGKKSRYHYRLIDYKNKQHKTDVLLSQTKCNLEVLPQGLMVVGNFTEKDSIIPILKNEIESITLIRGKEVIDTFYMSPMYILSKLGIPNRISRHLKVYPSEYKITETRVHIKCEDYELRLITDGNRFSKLHRSLKKLGYKNLKLLERPKLNLLQYRRALDL